MDHRRFSVRKFPVAAALLVATFASTARGQEISLVSALADGTQSDRDCIPAAISYDGRFVAFLSDARSLAGLVNPHVECYVKDRLTGDVELVSRNAAGVEANQDVRDVRISADGNFVVFSTSATNLDGADTNGGVADCYLYDRAEDSIELVSLGPDGQVGDTESREPVVSADGRYVAFTSYAHNFAADDDNDSCDVFLRDRYLNTTVTISVTQDGHVGNNQSHAADITSDGGLVVFQSVAHDLTDVRTTDYEVYVRDVAAGATTLLTLEMDGTPAVSAADPRCSADGNVVCFASADPLLVPNDTNGTEDIFVLDRVAGTVERVNVTTSGEQGGLSQFPTISADGRFVGFWCGPSDPLDPLDRNWAPDGYARDRLRGITFRVSVRDGGDPTDIVGVPAIVSGDGRSFLFGSPTDLAEEGDTNFHADVFVHERAPTPAISSHYGSGFPGELGIPTLTVGADPVLGQPIDVTIGSSSSKWILGFLALGVTPIDVRGSWGGDLLVAPLTLMPVPVTPSGYTLHAQIPYDAAFWNFVLEMQCLELDPAAAKGVSSTDGLELDFGY
jgi:Tol biopolymer transport system component